MHARARHAWIAFAARVGRVSRFTHRELGCPPARPRFASRVCCCQRAASAGSAARRASFASVWGRLSFAGAYDGCFECSFDGHFECPSRCLVLPRNQTVGSVRTDAPPVAKFLLFLRSVFLGSFLHAFDLVQRGRPFF